MKAEISNIADQNAKRFTSVVYQLSRMRTDWDDNASEQIRKNLLNSVSLTALGTGTPSHDGLIVQTQAAGQAMQLAVNKTGGKVVADGVVGELIVRKGEGIEPANGPYQNQADLELGGEPVLAKGLGNSAHANAQDYILYCDIWDRTLTAADDNELLDVALHGADTTGREQRCTQLKIAKLDDLIEAGSDLCKPTFKPRRIPEIGNGVFDLSLNDTTTSADECDPCATEVEIDEEVGNHLFRLEVHHVEYADRRPKRLVLKYSKENGARRLASDFTPEPEYVYEHCSQDGERLMGMPSDDWEPSKLYNSDPTIPSIRGVFKRTTVPSKEFVRRWDGYVDIEQKSGKWEITEAVHGDGTPTNSTIEDGSLTIGFAGMTMTLEIAEKTFLTGDAWFALLRNRAPSSPIDQRVKVVSPTPLGIHHHYCILGRIEIAGGKPKVEIDHTIKLLDGELTPHDRRRLQFPSLTCLGSQDVGYKTECPSGLFGEEHYTVEKALNRICEIEAKHVGIDPDCEYLKDREVTNLDEAVEALCERSTSVECAVKVRPDGLDPGVGFPDEWQGLLTLLAALQAHKELLRRFADANREGPRPGLAIEFMPGTYRWPEQGFTVISNLASFCLRGCCAGPVYLRFKNRFELHDCLGVTINDLHILIENTSAILKIGGGKDITIERTTIHRNAHATRPLLRLKAKRRIDLDENRFILENRSAVLPVRSLVRSFRRREPTVTTSSREREIAGAASSPEREASAATRLGALPLESSALLARLAVGPFTTLPAALPPPAITIYPCIQIANADARTLISNTFIDGHLILGNSVPTARAVTNSLKAIIGSQTQLGSETDELPSLSKVHLSNNSCRISDCQIMGIVPGQKEVADLLKWANDPKFFATKASSTPPAFRHLYIDNTEFERGDSLIQAAFVNLSNNRIERYGKLQLKNSEVFEKSVLSREDLTNAGRGRLRLFEMVGPWPLAMVVVASRANYDGNWGFLKKGDGFIAKLPVIADVSLTPVLMSLFPDEVAREVWNSFRYWTLPIDVEWLDLV